MNTHRQLERREDKSSEFYMTKVDQQQGIVEAVVSVFGVIDEGRDRIMPGAFTKTIAESAGRVRVVDQHNFDSIFRVLGRPIEIREIGREELFALVPSLQVKYPMALGGLLTRTQYNMKTERGRDAFNHIADGDINEYSIGYVPYDTDYEEVARPDGKGLTRVRNIRTVRLIEFSPVLLGMNAATATVDVKASSDEEQPMEIVTEAVDHDEKHAAEQLLTTSGKNPPTSLNHEEKAGRMFNRRNVERLRQIASDILAMLEDSGDGLSDAVEVAEDADAAKPEEKTTGDLAGPEVTPPTELLEKLKLRAAALERRLNIVQGEG